MENEAWASFKDMYPCQLGRYVLATHVCAYQCYLSQFVTCAGCGDMRLLLVSLGAKGPWLLTVWASQWVLGPTTPTRVLLV